MTMDNNLPDPEWVRRQWEYPGRVLYLYGWQGRTTPVASLRLYKFTLVELLIVISIIAILASLLLPALVAARDISQAAQCANSERQMIYAYTAYSDDSNGYTPVFNNYNFWYTNSNYAQYCGSRREYLKSKYYWKAGLLCPKAMGAIKDKAEDKGLSYYRMQLSYGFTFASISGNFTSFRIDKVVNPSFKICMVDATSWWVTYTRAYYPNYYAINGEKDLDDGTTAFRHPKLSANMTFFDGHSYRKVWKEIYSDSDLLYHPFK